MSARVLIVDDDLPTCEVIRNTLQTDGLWADVITEGTQAAARTRLEKFDCIFLDVRMPSPDGLELARDIRGSGLNQRTPIVMITGDREPGLLARCFAAGASFLLYKPIDRKRLLSVVHAAHTAIEREKRRFRRVPLRHRVLIHGEGRNLDGVTLDLSLNGLLVQAPRTLAQGTRVRLRLQLGSAGAPLEASGRVVRVVGEGMMGIQLDGLGSAESERLQEFLLPMILAASEQEVALAPV